MFNPEVEYDALLQSLRWNDGFGIKFLQGNRQACDRIIAKVLQDLPDTIAVTTFGQSLEVFLQTLPQQITTVFVQGLEPLLAEYDKALIESDLAGWLAYSQAGIPYLLPQSQISIQRSLDQFQVGLVFCLPQQIVNHCLKYFPNWNSKVFAVMDVLPESDTKTDDEHDQYNVWQPTGLRLRNLKTNQPLPPANAPHEYLFNRAMKYAENKQYEDAIALLDRAIELHREDDTFWCKRGTFLRHLERYEDAIADFAQALALNPHNDRTWFEQGYAFACMKHSEAALQSYDRALALRPDNPLGWNLRGTALQQLNRLEEAVASYERALAIAPDAVLCWHNRGDALNQLQRYQDAIESYDQAIALYPRNFISWNNRAFCLDALEQYEEAIANYDKALAIEPKYFSAWGNRAGSLEAVGRYQEALKSYDRALVICPIDAEIWCFRGVLLARLGQYEAALQSYDCALAIEPDSADSIYNKACCYSLQQRVELALDFLQQAIDLDPEVLDCAKTDADFDAIRQDERFQALIMEKSQALP
jgi:tetratricopeptide (TPR) repeat protein